MNSLPDFIHTAYDENEELKFGGYFRYIPEEMQVQFKRILTSYPQWENGVPFAVSVFGEILAWTDDGFVMLYNLPLNKANVLLEGFDYFASFIANKSVQSDYLLIRLFTEARRKLGEASETECYTFEPIPALGGNMALDSIGKGNTLAYISVIIQLLNREGEK